MKNCRISSVAGYLIYCIALSGTAQTVLRCDVGDHQTLHIERDSKIADTYVYYIRNGNLRTPVFGSLEDSRGTSVQAICTGHLTQALVLSGEFSGGYTKGVALTYVSGKQERVDFAEHARPGWVYRNAGELLVVVQTDGLGETNKKFTLYRHPFGSSAPASSEGADVLPDAKKYARSKLIGTSSQR